MSEKNLNLVNEINDEKLDSVCGGTAQPEKSGWTTSEEYVFLTDDSKQNCPHCGVVLPGANYGTLKTTVICPNCNNSVTM